MSSPTLSESMAAAILSDVLCSIVAPLIRFAAIGCSMYEVDGIDLTRSQYVELCALANLSSDDERKTFSYSTLHPHGSGDVWDSDGVWVYGELERMGLISGMAVMGGFLFDGRITRKGWDWVADFSQKEKERKRDIWSDRRFQIGLSLFTLILSTVAGWVAGLLA